MDTIQETGAIFIMPRSSKAWYGAEALWITAAGWSAAAKRKWGNAWVVTTDRIAQPDEVLHYPLVEPNVSSKKSAGSLSWLIPTFLKTLVKDIVLWRRHRNWKIINKRPWKNQKIMFVWQQHDLFPGPGHRLAKELNVPLVTYVHAPVVWEMSKWGVKRYFWGRFLERFYEARALKQSDVVACVSENVAEKLEDMGVEQEKILISPMAVDPFLFGQENSNCHLKAELALDNKFIIGWTGSFRSFHGLDQLVRAFQIVHNTRPDSRLLLVGDGFERKTLEDLVTALDLSDKAIFSGRQPFAKIPMYISIFDVAVLSARSAEDFHYSPLKLREYMAAGKPVVAANAGEIPKTFKDNYHLKLYTTGNVEELANKLIDIIDNQDERKAMAKHGKDFAMKSSTWPLELNKLVTSVCFNKRS